MNKNMKRFLSVFLAVMMVFSMLTPAWAIIERSEGGYYSLELQEWYNGGEFVKEIAIANYDPSIFESSEEAEAVAKQELLNMLDSDSAYLDKDLNDGAGGDYIYMGWNWTDDPYEAITGIRLLRWYTEEEPPTSYEEDGVMWYLANSGCHEWVPNLNPDGEGIVDLNDGAGGDYIFLYVTKDNAYGPPINRIHTQSSASDVGFGTDKIMRFKEKNDTSKYYSSYYYDVNAGTDGESIYLTVGTFFRPADIAELCDLLEQAEGYLNNAEMYKDVSALQTMYDNGQAMLEEWGGLDVKYASGTGILDDIYTCNSDLKWAIRHLEEISVTDDVETADVSIVMQIKNNIMVNGKNISSDAAPIIVDNRAMVPISVLPAMLGGTADWDEATRTVTLNMGGEVFSMTLDQPISDFGTSVVVRDGHVYVPIRYVAEKLGANVEWIAEKQQVLIEKWNNL